MSPGPATPRSSHCNPRRPIPPPSWKRPDERSQSRPYPLALLRQSLRRVAQGHVHRDDPLPVQPERHPPRPLFPHCPLLGPAGRFLRAQRDGHPVPRHHPEPVPRREGHLLGALPDLHVRETHDPPPLRPHRERGHELLPGRRLEVPRPPPERCWCRPRSPYRSLDQLAPAAVLSSYSLATTTPPAPTRALAAFTPSGPGVAATASPPGHVLVWGPLGTGTDQPLRMVELTPTGHHSVGQTSALARHLRAPVEEASRPPQSPGAPGSPGTTLLGQFPRKRPIH